MSYSLIDATALSKEYPLTFKTPSAARRNKLTNGDFVKLFFVDDLAPEFPERMWVQVSCWDINYGGAGRIANQPCGINAEYGDTISFAKKHILEIMTRKQYNKLAEEQG